MHMLHLDSQSYHRLLRMRAPVALISSKDDVNISDLLPHLSLQFFSDEQWNDGLLQPMILNLRDGELLEDGSTAKKIVTESVLFTLDDNFFTT